MPTTRRLAAILAADVAGYSRLMGADEEGTLERLRAIRTELIEPSIASRNGRTVKTTGDGFLAEFGSTVDALTCAGEIQAQMAERNLAAMPESRIDFRIGVHQGDIVVEDGDIFGDGVNIAARLEGIAEPGGICVSARVQKDAAGKLDLSFRDLGEPSLKNITRPVRAFAVEFRAKPAKSSSAEPKPLSLPDKPSIAVLPFTNMSGDLEQEYFVDGVVEEIITALAQIRWLFVIARNSTFTYKARAVDMKRVGRELGVRYALEGSVRKIGNRVRITGQLIDTTTGAHIWADRFDGALDDIFDLQDQVSVGVAGVIEPRLRASEIERANRKPTQSLDAYDLYLRAVGQFHRNTKDGARAAIDLLRQALVIDPVYAPAAALIAECYVTLGRTFISDAEVEEAIRLAREAIQWGKNDPEALWMAGICLSVFADEQALATSIIERALALNPNSAHAWNAKGYIVYWQNQLDTARDAFERAIRLSPLDPLSSYFSGGLALVNLASGRYEEALTWADRALHENPNLNNGLRSKIVACVQLGRIDEARKCVGRIVEL